MTDDGKEYIYLLADEAITGQGYSVVVDADYGCSMADTTSTAGTRGKVVAVPEIAVTSGYYFWGQVKGVAEVRVAASCAANATPNSTATGGVLDDDATAGAEVVEGMWLSEADGGSGGVVTAFLSYPHVGATI